MDQVERRAFGTIAGAEIFNELMAPFGHAGSRGGGSGGDDVVSSLKYRDDEIIVAAGRHTVALSDGV